MASKQKHRQFVDEEKLDSVPLPWNAKPYWNHVLQALSSRPIRNVDDLANILALIMEQKLDTNTLKLAVEAMNDPQFFATTLPFMVQLVKDSPTIIPNIPYLKIHSNSTLKLSRQQCACILANAFFCTFIRATNERAWHLFASINLDGLYESYNNLEPRIAKMLMILHYFSRICKKMPQGFVEFRRQCVPVEPNWSDSNKPLVQVTVDKSGSIEDHPVALQADFANAFIGGAAISYGCVQEEIRFAICPELIVSRLFCPVMDSNEAIIITGAEQFSKYKGYARTLAFDGDYVDPNVDAQGNCTVAIVAMDALIISRSQTKVQFSDKFTNRELYKAYAAFLPYDQTCHPVATGNWGCGAFGGDKELKFVLQWIAASEAGRAMTYCTFKDPNLDNNAASFVSAVQQRGVSVGQLFDAVQLVEPYVVKWKQPDLPSTFAILAKLLKLDFKSTRKDAAEFQQ